MEGDGVERGGGRSRSPDQRCQSPHCAGLPTSHTARPLATRIAQFKWSTVQKLALLGQGVSVDSKRGRAGGFKEVDDDPVYKNAGQSDNFDQFAQPWPISSRCAPQAHRRCIAGAAG